MVPKLVLLLFAAFEWLIAWCMRLLPRRDRSTLLFKGMAGLVVAAATVGGVGAEVFLYRSLSGQQSLRDDNFWFVAMIGQGLVMIAVGLNSWSVLKRKEREP